ncbi:Aste57867_22441 [Aphanomyces stellatus]|uniref:Aste57867_22441 protein n=1 Tax=Aphanomyces stellatus TaxID=120398 RepID=A0A485LKD5_9STRA|nr:hypothetical protein As57867_022371 [Aphanomyces stellatus]VFT99101.1 Aste57867_22441 [Aphanomyces stellatus]
MDSGQLEKPKPGVVKAEVSAPTAGVKRQRDEADEDNLKEDSGHDGKKLKGTLSKDIKGEKQADGSIVFDLSSKKQVTVRAWKSAILVDIREYYDSNGEKKPGKKGISLTKEQWKAVVTLADDIDTAVSWVQDSDSVSGGYEADTLDDVESGSVAFALSGKRRATVRKFKAMVLIDFREYYDASGVMKPGQKGISLTKDQWRMLKDRFDAIAAAMLDVAS